MKSLALKYRPKVWDDLTEQDATKTILAGQLQRNEIYHGYLFCGGAGTGKTTSARIFANEINHGDGNPIEIDAASNSGVDNVRDIIKEAKTRAIDAEYKVFIVDECHSLSNTAWQAMLKLLEEPPEKSIFIFCTTDPQKIPGTILSRIQRYNFQRISKDGIANRLRYILENENITGYDKNAPDYLAELADGGMRDAITMLDKCLSYDATLKLSSINDALGLVQRETFSKLTSDLNDKNVADIVNDIEEIYKTGYDLKQFIYQYILYLLQNIRNDNDSEKCLHFLPAIVRVNNDIKWISNPKAMIEAELLSIITEGNE